RRVGIAWSGDGQRACGDKEAEGFHHGCRLESWPGLDVKALTREEFEQCSRTRSRSGRDLQRSARVCGRLGSVPTTKISVAIDNGQLRLVRAAAKTEGLSVSAYIARALGKQLEDQHRINAARELHASWGASAIPTAADRKAFLAQMSRPQAR